MLLVFMYHRIVDNKAPQNLELFTKHLNYLIDNYPIVVPGDQLPKNKISICLTFDDAYFDFYHSIFPMLKKFNIKATVAVPIKFIIEESNLDHQVRLNVPYDQAMTDPVYKNLAPFCTWKELQEMVASGQVMIASHSYNHINLTQANVDLDQEIMGSKVHLEKKLNCEVNTFVYPYGKWNNSVHKKVREVFTYPMRIGSSLNLDWHNGNNKVIYRVDADHFWKHDLPWNKADTVKYFLKYISNRVRGK